MKYLNVKRVSLLTISLVMILSIISCKSGQFDFGTPPTEIKEIIKIIEKDPDVSQGNGASTTTIVDCSLCQAGGEAGSGAITTEKKTCAALDFIPKDVQVLMTFNVNELMATNIVQELLSVPEVPTFPGFKLPTFEHVDNEDIPEVEMICDSAKLYCEPSALQLLYEEEIKSFYQAQMQQDIANLATKIWEMPPEVLGKTDCVALAVKMNRQLGQKKGLGHIFGQPGNYVFIAAGEYSEPTVSKAKSWLNSIVDKREIDAIDYEVDICDPEIAPDCLYPCYEEITFLGEEILDSDVVKDSGLNVFKSKQIDGMKYVFGNLGDKALFLGTEGILEDIVEVSKGGSTVKSNERIMAMINSLPNDTLEVIITSTNFVDKDDTQDFVQNNEDYINIIKSIIDMDDFLLTSNRLDLGLSLRLKQRPGYSLHVSFAPDANVIDYRQSAEVSERLMSKTSVVKGVSAMLVQFFYENAYSELTSGGTPSTLEEVLAEDAPAPMCKDLAP